MKRGKVSSSAGFETSECAAYGLSRPPLPLRDFGGYHDYDPVETVTPADDICEDEDYEVIPQ